MGRDTAGSRSSGSISTRWLPATFRGERLTTNLSELPELLTIKEAADYLRITKETLRQWKRQGLVSFTQVGVNVFRVQRSEVARLVSQGLNK
jgi:excisionase family DNA binding protein